MGRRRLFTSTSGWSVYLPSWAFKLKHVTPSHRPTNGASTRLATAPHQRYKSNTCKHRGFLYQRQHHHPQTFRMVSSSPSRPPKHHPHRSTDHHPHRSTGHHSRTSLSYPIPERLRGRLQPPPHAPAYILNNPSTWPYARACMATDRDLELMKKREKECGMAAPNKSNHNPPPRSPPSRPCQFRSALNSAQLKRLLTWLPLPPDSSHPYWVGRCFECFAYEHRGDKCPGLVVCRDAFARVTLRDCARKVDPALTYLLTFNQGVTWGMLDFPLIDQTRSLASWLTLLPLEKTLPASWRPMS